MDRGAWRATVHGVIRVGHILATKSPPPVSTPVFSGFPCGSAGKEFTYNAGDLGSICGLGRSPGEGERLPTPVSGLENSMDCIVHRFTKSRTQLSDFHFHYIYLDDI